MRWYDSNRLFRVPLSCPGGGSGARDSQLTIPPTFLHFWANVKSDHYDVVVTGPDGVTAMDFEFSSWTYASKVGVIDVDDVTALSGETALLWLYYGYAGASSSEETALAGFSALDTIYLAEHQPPGPLLSAAREAPGLTTPARLIAKATDDTLMVYWDPAPLLARLARAANKNRFAEGIEHAVLAVEAAGTPQASMIDAGETRFLQGRIRGGPPLIQTLVKAGTVDTDYTAILTVRTTLGQVITSRALLQVRDPDES